MTIKKIILIVILLTVVVTGIIFLVQKSDKRGENKIENKNEVIYKLAENGCKLGVDSISNEKLGINFYRICRDGSITLIDPQKCKFKECPILNEVNILDWSIYKNEKYKFSLKYPKDWKVLVNEPEGGAKKIEVSFSNKNCPGGLWATCPVGYSGYTIIFYETTLEQSQKDIKNVEYLEKISDEIKKIKLFSGENISLYIRSEFNENNFREAKELILPGAQTVLGKNGYSIYFTGDFRGDATTLGYFEASLGTFGFDL